MRIITEDNISNFESMNFHKKDIDKLLSIQYPEKTGTPLTPGSISSNITESEEIVNNEGEESKEDNQNQEKESGEISESSASPEEPKGYSDSSNELGEINNEKLQTDDSMNSSKSLQFNPATPENIEFDYGLSSSEKNDQGAVKVDSIMNSINDTKEEVTEFPSVTMKIDTEPKNKTEKIETISTLIKETNKESLLEQKDDEEDKEDENENSESSEVKKSVKIDS